MSTVNYTNCAFGAPTSHHPSGAPRDVVAVLREHRRQLRETRAGIDARLREHERDIDAARAELDEVNRALASVDQVLAVQAALTERRADAVSQQVNTARPAPTTTTNPTTTTEETTTP